MGGRKFVLVHGGLGNFSPAKPLSEYEEDEIVWSRPDADTFYYEDKYVVLGHTQTPILYGETGKMPPDAAFYKTGGYIDIDCGCAYMGGRLGCLCLETMEEFYVSRDPIGNFERMKIRLYCGQQQKRSPA